MLNNISIQNFRIFNKKTDFKLSPITLLTGPNNSGKSSFTKFLSLISSNFKRGGNFVKLNFSQGNHQLGEFENILSWKSDLDKVIMEFDFPLDFFNEKFKIKLDYKQYLEEGRLSSFKIYNKNRVLCEVSEIESDFKGYEIAERGDDTIKGNNQIHWTYSIDINYIKKTIAEVNGQDINKKFILFDYRYDNTLNSDFSDLLYSLEELYFKYKETYVSFSSNAKSDYLKEVLEGKGLFEGFNFFNISYFFNQCLDTGGLEYDESINSIIKNIELRHISYSYKYEELFDNIIGKNISKGFRSLNKIFDSFSFISAIRGNRSRIMMNYGDNEIDSLVREFSQFVGRDNRYHNFLEKSLDILGIKGKLEVNRIEGFGTVAYINTGDNKVSLADLGYGYSQIIPILLKIMIETEKIFIVQDVEEYSDIEKRKSIIYPTIVIEEPESNLHPKLQSKLADIFVLAYKEFGVHLIIETHSEYLIRKLQFLTAKNEIDPSDTSIYYFNSDEFVSKEEEKVKRIEINPNGGLTDTFGPGFYDEATNLQFDLLKLNKAKEN